jgi:hypothetical protein
VHAPANEQFHTRGFVYMRHLLIFGFAFAALTAISAAQDTQPRIKHYRDGTQSTKSVPVAKAPPATTPATNLHKLEQQSTKVSTPPRVKRAPGTAALLKTEKQKPNPPINFSGSHTGAKGPGTTNQGSNPYRGRLRQKGSQH